MKKVNKVLVFVLIFALVFGVVGTVLAYSGSAGYNAGSVSNLFYTSTVRRSSSAYNWIQGQDSNSGIYIDGVYKTDAYQYSVVCNGATRQEIGVQTYVGCAGSGYMTINSGKNNCDTICAKIRNVYSGKTMSTRGTFYGYY